MNATAENATAQAATPKKDPPRKPIPLWKSLVLAILVVIAGIVAWFPAPGTNWILTLATLVIFMMFLGDALTDRLLGFLINERKLMSLSRFQMALWTVLIISAYLVIALMRVKKGIADPLVISIDWQIWTLLGISTASLVGTPLLNDNKRNKTPGNKDKSQQEVLQKAAEGFGESAATVEEHRDGLLYGNAEFEDARFTDLFEGDELGNTRFIELAQVQMFFFTVLVALVYGVQLFQMISDPKFLEVATDANGVKTVATGLPLLPEGLLALMGVSNAGYLGNKAIPKTPSSA